VAVTAAPTATSPPATVGSDWRRINGSLTVTQLYRSGRPHVTAYHFGLLFLLLSCLRERQTRRI
jgi:hypothetical protein